MLHFFLVALRAVRADLALVRRSRMLRLAVLIEAPDAAIEAVLAKGQQAVPTALAIGGALATAVGGAALNLPAVINGGQAGAVAVYIRVLDSTGAPGIHLDLSLQTGVVKEFAV